MKRDPDLVGVTALLVFAGACLVGLVVTLMVAAFLAAPTITVVGVVGVAVAVRYLWKLTLWLVDTGRMS